MAINFNNMVLYGKTWKETSREQFSEENINEIQSIEVVAGNYGLSAQVELPGGNTFYPIHRDSVPLSVGDKLDPKQCTIIHLQRGESTTDKLLYTGETL